MQSAQFELHAQVEERHWWFQGRRDIVRRIVHAILPPDKNALVVDVGCGTGGNIAALSREYRCVGIDTSADAIRLARQRFGGVQFLQGIAPDDLGALAGEARLYLLMDVLEHISDDFLLLSRLLSAAAPGTWFLITVPADMALWSPHDVSFGHYRRYSLPRLRNVWEGLRVREVLLSYYNSRLYPIVRYLRARNRRRGAALGAAGTDFSLPPPPANWLLRRILSGESPRLLARLQRGGDTAFPRGVSLLAVLQRLPGEIAERQKPADAGPDAHVPGGSEELASVG